VEPRVSPRRKHKFHGGGIFLTVAVFHGFETYEIPVVAGASWPQHAVAIGGRGERRTDELMDSTIAKSPVAAVA